MSQNPKQIAQAFLFLSSPLSSQTDIKKLQQSLLAIENAQSQNKLVQSKIMELLIQRYYELANLYPSKKIEEFILIKIIRIVGKFVTLVQLADFDSLIVIAWASINLLKKATPENQHKEQIKQVLTLIEIIVSRLLSDKKFKAATIYPQISAVLMNYILNYSLINHIIFGKSLAILSSLLSNIFSIGVVPQIPSLVASPSTEKSFSDQCLSRLEPFLKFLISKIPNLELTYHESVKLFVQKTIPLFMAQIPVLCSLNILGILVGMHPQFQKYSNVVAKILRSVITSQFIQVLSEGNNKILTRNITLKRALRLVKYIEIGQKQCSQVIKKLVNSLYTISNSRSLIVPHLHDTTQTSNLVQLNGDHSFSNYPVGISALLQSFDFQCERVLLIKIPYAETSLENVGLLKAIIENMGSQAAQIILERLVQDIGNQENGYVVNMSLTKFCQYLTKVLIVYWILRKIKSGFKPKISITLNLFQIFSSSQALRILQPSYEQQQILMGFSLLSSYFCYKSIMEQGENKQLKNTISQIKKLKLKLSLLQMCINNLSTTSPITKSSIYYILLCLCAPNSVSYTLQNLQSTLINRNITNLAFISSLLELCQLSGQQCQDLAERLNKRVGSEHIIKGLLPRLKTDTVRKCLLSAGARGGKWVYVLTGNSKLLYNRPIAEGQENINKETNFYMNDGENVRITNALGVVLLQLGNKWENTLAPDCPYREATVDLINQIIDLSTDLVFFKIRFISILNCLVNLITNEGNTKNTGGQSQLKSSSRLNLKISKILSKIPKQTYKIYDQRLKQSNESIINESKPPIGKQQKLVLTRLKAAIQKNIKYYKKLYFVSSSNIEAKEMYEISQSILEKIEQENLQINGEQNGPVIS